MSVEQHRAQSPARVNCFVLTVSDTRTLATETSGRTIAGLLEDAGHAVIGRNVVRDEPQDVAAAIREDLERALELRLEAPHLVEAREGLRQHGAILAGGDLLRKIADGHAGITMDAPLVWLLDRREDPADGGLSRPVRADEPDALPAADTPGAVVEQLLASVALGDRVEPDHGRRLPRAAFLSPPSARGRARSCR